MQPGLQQPGHDLKTFPGRRREDELKARGTFSCYHLPAPLWEKTLPAPAPSAGQEHERSLAPSRQAFGTPLLSAGTRRALPTHSHENITGCPDWQCFFI